MTVETHPKLETLAAFVDGRLEDLERRTVVEHLGTCEECYELVAEAMLIGEELEEDGEGDSGPDGEESSDPSLGTLIPMPEASPPGEPRSSAEEPPSSAPDPIPPRRSRRWFLTIAASLLLAGFVGLVFWSSRPVDPLVSQIASVDLPPESFDYEFAAVRRSAFDPDEVMLALRFGARLFDLETALQRKDQDAAEDALLWLNETLTGKHLFHTDRFGRLAISLEEDGIRRARRELDALWPFQRQMLQNSGFEGPFELGWWAEAGRLAAVAEDRDWLASDEFRRRGQEVLALGLNPGLKRALEEQLEALEDSLEGDGLPKARIGFEKILRIVPDAPETAP